MTNPTTKPQGMVGFLAMHQAILKNFAKFEEHVNNLPSIDQTRAYKLQEWFNYMWVLVEHHHLGEDEQFFPTIGQRVADFRQHIAELSAQHQNIEALVAQIKQDLASLKITNKVADRLGLELQLKRQLAQFQVAMTNHLNQEEELVINAVTANFSEAEQTAMEDRVRQGMSPDFMSRVVPWMVDALEPEAGNQLLAVLPPPIQQLYQHGWKPQYDRMMAGVRS